MQSRRDFLTSAAAALAYSSGVKPLHALQGVSHGTSQRTVVVMFDGFGLDFSGTELKNACVSSFLSVRPS
jgi:hypothetical protein